MRTVRWTLPLLVIACCCSLADASPIAHPASQIARGRASLTLHYTRSDGTINFQTSSRDEVVVGGTSYFSSASSTLEGQTTRSGVSAKFLINPRDGLHYWITAGAGSFDLDVPSITVRNRYTTQENGLIAGVGARKLLFPDTLFSPAVSVEAGIIYEKYALESFRQGVAAPVRVDARLELTELQAAVNISKKFSRFEPYGGLKVFRTYARFSDRSTIYSVGGVKDNAGIFLGTKFRVYPDEALVIEASFIGDISFSAGWNIAF